jgi:hypothetical protein
MDVYDLWLERFPRRLHWTQFIERKTKSSSSKFTIGTMCASKYAPDSSASDKFTLACAHTKHPTRRPTTVASYPLSQYSGVCDT